MNKKTFIIQPSDYARMRAAAKSTIQNLNDRLRVEGRGGLVIMTEGIAALGLAKVGQIFASLSEFDSFTKENDPYGEHDFAIFEAGGERIAFKIEYFDRARKGHSPNPADRKVTTRVLTVMLAQEY